MFFYCQNSWARSSLVHFLRNTSGLCEVVGTRISSQNWDFKIMNHWRPLFKGFAARWQTPTEPRRSRKPSSTLQMVTSVRGWLYKHLTDSARAPCRNNRRKPQNTGNWDLCCWIYELLHHPSWLLARTRLGQLLPVRLQHATQRRTLEPWEMAQSTVCFLAQGLKTWVH